MSGDGFLFAGLRVVCVAKCILSFCYLFYDCCCARMHYGARRERRRPMLNSPYMFLFNLARVMCTQHRCADLSRKHSFAMTPFGNLGRFSPMIIINCNLSDPNRKMMERMVFGFFFFVCDGKWDRKLWHCFRACIILMG